MREKAVVVFSGGQDSTTCLFWALREGYDVDTLTVNYGQRHATEIAAAKCIARMAGVKNTVMNVPGVLLGASPLISENKLDTYADAASLPTGLEKTFVPLRNQLLITLAANYAYSVGSTVLVYGNCLEDFDGYPDCRPDFIKAVEAACNTGTFTDSPLRILTPLMHLSKKETVMLAADLDGCMDALAYSHTAYDGKYPPLCNDHASLLRAKGFEDAGVPDPLVIRAVREGLMQLPTTKNYKGENVSIDKDIRA